jgi:hypothetical protein
LEFELLLFFSLIVFVGFNTSDLFVLDLFFFVIEIEFDFLIFIYLYLITVIIIIIKLIITIITSKFIITNQLNSLSCHTNKKFAEKVFLNLNVD